MGLFFDFNNTTVIKAYLGEDNIVKIQKELTQLQDVENLLSWYEKQPKLSDAQIEADWQDFLIRSESKIDTRAKRHRIAMHKAYHRGLGWVTNYFHNPSNIDEEISDETLEKAMKYLQNW